MEINHKPAKTIRGTKTFRKIKRPAYLLDLTKLLHKSLHIVSLNFFLCWDRAEQIEDWPFKTSRLQHSSFFARPLNR